MKDTEQIFTEEGVLVVDPCSAECAWRRARISANIYKREEEL